MADGKMTGWGTQKKACRLAAGTGTLAQARLPKPSPDNVLQWRRSRLVRCLRLQAGAATSRAIPGAASMPACSRVGRSCIVQHQQGTPPAPPSPHLNATHLQVSATQATAASALYSRPRSSSCRSWPHWRSSAHTDPSAHLGGRGRHVWQAGASGNTVVVGQLVAQQPLLPCAAGEP